MCISDCDMELYEEEAYKCDTHNLDSLRNLCLRYLDMRARRCLRTVGKRGRSPLIADWHIG